MPLERDEGEYAYLGQLILKGIMPFKIAYSLKFPGGFFMYAVVCLFSVSRFRCSPGSVIYQFSFCYSYFFIS